MGDSCISVSSPRAIYPLFMLLLTSREDVRAPPASAQDNFLVYAATKPNCSILDWENFPEEAI